MDFTKFSDENFDLKDWINNAFTSQKESNQNQEQFVATLITKLQVFIQEINNSIDDTSQQTVQNFPRILREIEVLKQETFMLKEQMKNVRDDLIKVEKNTVNESMKSLLDLDVMRTNLFSVKMALQEADNWTTLTSDLDSVLQSKDINEISNHIESMQNSLALLQDETNDYLVRCSLLEDFKNKFETLMSSDLISAFNSKSIDLSKNYIQIFGKMNRLNETKKYYYQCEKVKILDKLNQLLNELSLNDSSVDSQNNVGQVIQTLLKSWFDYLIEVWHNETQWCKQIFNDSHSIVINLITKCVEEFNKTLAKLIDNLFNLNELSGSSNEAKSNLEYLNQFKQETDHFATNIYSNAQSSGLLKTSQLNDLLYKLFQQLYMPYKMLSKEYGKLVTSYLKHQLDKNIKLNHPDTVECVQLLNNSVTKVFYLIEIELARCDTYTNCCGLAMLIESLKSFLKSYIEEFKRIVSNLKERKYDGSHSLHNTPTQVSSLQTSATVPSSLNMIKSHHHGNFHDDDVEDWDTFRHFVKIIQIVGDLMIKYESLEETIDKQIQNNFIHKKHSNNNSNNKNLDLDSNNLVDLLSINNYKEYLLDDSERIKLNKLIAVIESGDDYTIMKDLVKPLYNLSENVHKNAFDIVFAPIKSLLRGMPKLNTWHKANDQKQETVPLFALAPQEYITKIGQYLLTLPQNFEPFTMQDNTNLLVALKKSKLPYLDEKDLSEDIMACWLDAISNATVVNYCEEIINIQQIQINAQRQLIIDIEFICSVFEDVGLKDFNNLKHILELLKVDKEEFENLTKNKPAKIVSAVRKMRSI